MQNKPQLGYQFDASASMPEQQSSTYRWTPEQEQQSQQKIVQPSRHWDEGNTSHYRYEG